jgi:hypothetical protein
LHWGWGVENPSLYVALLIDYVKGHGDKAVLLILEKIDRD